MKNILVILCDQLRRNAISMYGDPNIQTPHLDQLATSGTRFSQASSTSPICIPFRFSFMTGEYAHTRSTRHPSFTLSPAERCVAHEFNDAGYETLYIGKWHLYGNHGPNPAENKRHSVHTWIPETHRGGWQHWHGYEVCNDHFNTWIHDDDEMIHLPGYQTDVLTDLTIEHLEERSESEKPFLMMLSVEPPHFPYEAPPELEQKWRDTSLTFPDSFLETPDCKTLGFEVQPHEIPHQTEQNQLYYAMIENLDQNVGRIMQTLKKTGLDKTTTVVFLSDHGEMGGRHNLQAFRKSYPFEESVGIPFFVHEASAGAPAGQEILQPTSTEDFYPTLCGLAGISCKDVPGKDLSPLVRGESSTLDREFVLLEHVGDNRDGPFAKKQWRGVRSRRYKYTVLGDAQGCEPWQFYDLQEDPLERRNLLNGEPEHHELKRHHHALRTFVTQNSDPFVLSPHYGAEGYNLPPKSENPS